MVLIFTSVSWSWRHIGVLARSGSITKSSWRRRSSRIRHRRWRLLSRLTRLARLVRVPEARLELRLVLRRETRLGRWWGASIYRVVNLRVYLLTLRWRVLLRVAIGI